MPSGRKRGKVTVCLGKKTEFIGKTKIFAEFFKIHLLKTVSIHLPKPNEVGKIELELFLIDERYFERCKICDDYKRGPRYFYVANELALEEFWFVKNEKNVAKHKIIKDREKISELEELIKIEDNRKTDMHLSSYCGEFVFFNYGVNTKRFSIDRETLKQVKKTKTSAKKKWQKIQEAIGFTDYCREIIALTEYEGELVRAVVGYSDWPPNKNETAEENNEYKHLRKIVLKENEKHNRTYGEDR